MKVGPISIEKEDGYQQWRVALTIQHLSYYVRWYSSHLYTKQEAIEKFMKDTQSDLWVYEGNRPGAGSLTLAYDLLDEARTALLFLEVEEME